jgi:hypothetical protein
MDLMDRIKRYHNIPKLLVWQRLAISKVISVTISHCVLPKANLVIPVTVPSKMWAHYF